MKAISDETVEAAVRAHNAAVLAAQGDLYDFGTIDEFMRPAIEAALAVVQGVEACATCEGEGEVAKNFGAYGPGRPEIVPCPDCRRTRGEEA